MRRVADIMTKDCHTVTPQDNLYEAAVLMKQHDVGFIPVVEPSSRKLLGVITDRDLVIRGYAEKHSGSTAVTAVMTEDVETISPNLSVDEAAAKMAENQIRRLPVVEGGELLGIVSIGDLAVREIFVNEAGDALSRISEQDAPGHAIH
ncbi:CBS domain-containing protein [Cohnella nanjingensis]|uniref:CBS domain-containing protein n=1 Tax=Cohnella nanjingensis TaxID=1387779 RepID=A0A7X0RP67_9BACL|nr:CBS domain-containing protein [Cohnella nanjingensis]MBB6671142.1 CBS domain-containing protein [Cohnella nanjingensis]